jgi:hypothetical protein
VRTYSLVPSDKTLQIILVRIWSDYDEKIWWVGWENHPILTRFLYENVHSNLVACSKIQLPNHRLSITIDTTIRGFLSAQIDVAVIFIFQKFHFKQGSLRLFDRWSVSIWIFYLQPNVKLQEKIDKQKIGAFGTTFIAKICHSPWSSSVFLLSKVHNHHKNSFGGAGGSGRKKLYWNSRIVASIVILNLCVQR